MQVVVVRAEVGDETYKTGEEEKGKKRAHKKGKRMEAER
jgi:hypothetical protein